VPLLRVLRTGVGGDLAALHKVPRGLSPRLIVSHFHGIIILLGRAYALGLFHAWLPGLFFWDVCMRLFHVWLIELVFGVVKLLLG